MLAAPLRERNLFVTGPGPASGGSKPGKDTRAQRPEKSGIDAAPCVLLLAGATSCPKAGVAAVAAKITIKRKSRCLRMPTSLSWLARAHSGVAAVDLATCHFGSSSGHFRDGLKYLKSGGGWSLRVGISIPSPL